MTDREDMGFRATGIAAHQREAMQDTVRVPRAKLEKLRVAISRYDHGFTMPNVYEVLDAARELCR